MFRVLKRFGGEDGACDSVLRNKLMFALKRAQIAFTAGNAQEGTNWLQTIQNIIEVHRTDPKHAPSCLLLLNQIEVPLNLLTSKTVPANLALPYIQRSLITLQNSPAKPVLTGGGKYFIPIRHSF